jgi:ATP-dependent Lon protease
MRHLQVPSSSSSPSPSAAVPLSLRQARAMLDNQHYGLDKIKDR